MSKRMDEILKTTPWEWKPCLNPTGECYTVCFYGEGVAFENKANAELFAERLGKGMKSKPHISASSETGGEPHRNPNIEADFRVFHETWLHYIGFAQTIDEEEEIDDWDCMMVSAYSAGLWFFRKAMRRIEEDHQETMKALESLKRRIDELEEMI